MWSKSVKKINKIQVLWSFRLLEVIIHIRNRHLFKRIHIEYAQLMIQWSHLSITCFCRRSLNFLIVTASFSQLFHSPTSVNAGQVLVKQRFVLCYNILGGYFGNAELLFLTLHKEANSGLIPFFCVTMHYIFKHC